MQNHQSAQNKFPNPIRHIMGDIEIARRRRETAAIEMEKAEARVRELLGFLHKITSG